ncbi:MAG: hypothetical protein H6807_12615 [Planctomycetes bacterium]|nr:hypothetical protein [Planctomycetota bacterium]
MQASEEAGFVREENATPRTLGLLGRFLRRRRFLLDSHFQGRLLLAFLVQVLIFAFILALALFMPLVYSLSRLDGQSQAFLEASRQMVALDARFWPALVLASLLAVLMAIRTSHKVAGPMFRFRHVFGLLERGEDPGRVRLRRGDFLLPEAEMLDRVARSVVLDRDRLRAIERQVRLLMQEIENEGDEVSEKVRRLMERRLGHLLAEARDR